MASDSQPGTTVADTAETVQDLYNQLQTTCAAIDRAKNALAARLSELTTAARRQVQGEILSLSVKQGQLQGAFIQAAMQTSDIRDALASISTITDKLDAAAKEVTDATQVVQTATKMMGYVADVIGVIAPFLAL